MGKQGVTSCTEQRSHKHARIHHDDHSGSARCRSNNCASSSSFILLALRFVRGRWVASMNPRSLEGTTMVPTTFNLIRTFTRGRRVVRRPDAVPDAPLNLPRRIGDPASAAADDLEAQVEQLYTAIQLPAS